MSKPQFTAAELRQAIRELAEERAAAIRAAAVKAAREEELLKQDQARAQERLAEEFRLKRARAQIWGKP